MNWRAATSILLLNASVLGPASGLEEQGPPIRSGVNRHVRRETYEVDGLTAAEIRRDLNRRGPLSSGKRFDARTEWNVHWWFELERVPGGCRVAHTRVDLGVVVMLPRWRRPAEAGPELVERWERYLTALRDHEDGHRAIGASATDEILATFAALPPAPTCPLAEKRANRAGQDIVARYKQRDEQYDSNTRHGAAQGARFP